MEIEVTFVQEDMTLDFSDEKQVGTGDYTKLKNKPSINGVTLSGNKTSEELHITSSGSGLTERIEDETLIFSLAQ